MTMLTMTAMLRSIPGDLNRELVTDLYQMAQIYSTISKIEFYEIYYSYLHDFIPTIMQ
jgi:hypothetical protein